MREKHHAEDLLVEVQRDILRLAKTRGMSPKRIAALTGLNETTIKSWAGGTAMPAWAFAVLSQVIDDDLTTLMFEQFDKFVGSVAPEDGGLERVAHEAARFVAGHHDTAALGTISPMHREKGRMNARRLGCIAFSAARPAAPLRNAA